MSPDSRKDRSLLRLSLPIIAIQIGTLTMGLVDTIIVGQMSPDIGKAGEGLSYVGVGHAWSFFWIVFGLGALMAIDPLISQATGARDFKAAGRAVQRGVILAFLYSIPLGIPLVFSGSILKLILNDEAVAAGAGAYSSILVVGLPALLTYTALRLSLQSMKRLAPAFYAILAANVINFFATRLMVPGYEPWGIPAMAATGAAWATVTSQWTMAFMVVLAGWKTLRVQLLSI
jgi:MATE family multidrug resistance protein